MEVYYKELISEDASLDRLVDELTRVVQGADELAEAASAHLTPEASQEIHSRMERLKGSCARLKESARAGAVATDKALRQHPYSSLAIAFAVGIFGALLFCRARKTEDVED
jgi:ElaB/YqjD/DUF883 family membrane-anchored ribosome-binding protein